MSDSDLNVSILTKYLGRHLDGMKGPLKVEKFSGGQSNPTYLLTSENNRYVLRRKPTGSLLKSAHAVDREFRVMMALKNSDVPVAIPLLLCDDESVIGTMFYVMEYVDGRVMWDPALPDSTASNRFEIYSEMNRVMASLHQINIADVGLSDYGRPGNYYERQVNRWITQYHASEIEKIADMDWLIDWLPNNTPPDDGHVSLVHGDFRLDNMLFHPQNNQILAVVDWELSTLGHPFADLAYQCMQLRMARDGEIQGLGGIGRTALGIPSEQEYVAQYCQRVGINRIANWNFYLAFSAFRFAAILQGVKKRAIDGNASSDKAHKMGDMVTPLAKMAVDLVR